MFPDVSKVDLTVLDDGSAGSATPLYKNNTYFKKAYRGAQV